VNEIKYDINDRKNLDTRTTVTDVKFRVPGQILDTRTFGDVVFSAEYNYRKSSDEIGSDVTNTYAANVAISKKLSDKYRLRFFAEQELQTFGGSAPTPGAEQASPIQGQVQAREDQHESTYRIAAVILPFPSVSVNSSFAIINTAQSNTLRYGADVKFVFPWISLPVSSKFSKQTREIPDLPRQSLTSFESELTYKFRKITLNLSLEYSKEVLVANTFSFHEISGDLTRRFDIF
jgi:hypothetical protein